MYDEYTFSTVFGSKRYHLIENRLSMASYVLARLRYDNANIVNMFVESLLWHLLVATCFVSLNTLACNLLTEQTNM